MVAHDLHGIRLCCSDTLHPFARRQPSNVATERKWQAAKALLKQAPPKLAKARFQVLSADCCAVDH